jgi:hypothetical protein
MKDDYPTVAVLYASLALIHLLNLYLPIHEVPHTITISALYGMLAFSHLY